MLAIFVHSLRRSLGAILGWGSSLALLAYFMLSFYDTFMEQSVQLQALVSQYPPELMAFFGGSTDLYSPAGFLNMEFFSYMPLVLGIFAVLAGSGMIVAEEESGVLDLLLAHPVSRTAQFFGRLLAQAVTLAGILAICWLAFVLGDTQSQRMNFTALELFRPFVSLFAVLFLFQSLSLLLSLLLPSRNMAGMTAGLLLTASYFIQSLSLINEDLKQVAAYLPLKYYQGGEAANGLNGDWVAGLLGIGSLFAVLAWWLFLRRDIRVSGEGNWRLPGLFATGKKDLRSSNE
jgi:ABC-2 type transport system permease protein